MAETPADELQPLPPEVKLNEVKFVGYVEDWTCPICLCVIGASLLEDQAGNEWVGHWH